MKYLSKVYRATDVGLVRSGNEDALAIFPPECYMVADGMGGHVAGEVASGLLVRVVQEYLQGKTSLDANELRSAILVAHKEIQQVARNNAAYSGMGTTATIFHIEAGLLYWAHVGDSRLYLLRNGELVQVTRDHSYVEELVERGKLTESEARVHPQKNMLTRAVGMDGKLEVDGGQYSLEEGDTLLLATDGLMNMVPNEAICRILSEKTGDKAMRLVSEALAAGGRDNVTVIVLEYAS